MRAAVLREHGEPLAIEDIERPEPDLDQVVVETEACGVCRSDWHAWQGDWKWVGAQAQPGQVLGHEPAGVVAEVGDDVETLREGDRVAVPFALADGTCRHCQNGRANVCETMSGWSTAGNSTPALSSRRRSLWRTCRTASPR